RTLLVAQRCCCSMHARGKNGAFRGGVTTALLQCSTRGLASCAGAPTVNGSRAWAWGPAFVVTAGWSLSWCSTRATPQQWQRNADHEHGDPREKQWKVRASKAIHQIHLPRSAIVSIAWSSLNTAPTAPTGHADGPFAMIA